MRAIGSFPSFRRSVQAPSANAYRRFARGSRFYSLPLRGARGAAMTTAFYRRHMHRGGFFKDVFRVARKAIQPLIGTVAKTVVAGVPVLGGIVTAVGAIKSAVHPPTTANTGNTTATTGAPPVGQPPAPSASRAPGAPRRRRRSPGRRRRSPARARRSRGRARRGVSAKQRAARARFARAARKGRIRKGSRL